MNSVGKKTHPNSINVTLWGAPERSICIFVTSHLALSPNCLLSPFQGQVCGRSCAIIRLLVWAGSQYVSSGHPGHAAIPSKPGLIQTLLFLCTPHLLRPGLLHLMRFIMSPSSIRYPHFVVSGPDFDINIRLPSPSITAVLLCLTVLL